MFFGKVLGACPCYQPIRRRELCLGISMWPMLRLRGFLAVVLVASILAVPLYYFRNRLTQGMEPSASTMKLTDLEGGAPDLVLPSIDGTTVKLADYRGKIVIVNFWATWCGPCVKEYPSLVNLARKMGDKIEILAISYDQSKDDILVFKKSFGAVPANFKILWDETKASGKRFGTEVLPESYIFDKHLHLSRKVAGETEWDNDLAVQFFMDLWERN